MIDGHPGHRANRLSRIGAAGKQQVTAGGEMLREGGKHRLLGLRREVKERVKRDHRIKALAQIQPAHIGADPARGRETVPRDFQHRGRNIDARHGKTLRNQPTCHRLTRATAQIEHTRPGLQPCDCARQPCLFKERAIARPVPLSRNPLIGIWNIVDEAEPNFYRPPKELAQLRESYGTFEKYFDGSVSAFIACSQRKVVGFISGSVRNVQSLISPEKRVGFINELIVAENHRNLGIGLSLMDKMESDLCTAGTFSPSALLILSSSMSSLGTQ